MKCIRYVIFACFVLAWAPIFSLGDEHHATGLSPAEIQRAIDAASPGDVVILPAGNAGGDGSWNVEESHNAVVVVKAGVSIRGQGVNSTVIRQLPGAGQGLTFFCFNPSRASTSYTTEIQGFKLIGAGTSGPSSTGVGMYLYGLREIYVHDIWIEDKSSVLLAVDDCEGVVCNSTFRYSILETSHGSGGYGVGVKGAYPRSWPSSYPNPNLGTEHAVFIEDNTFYGCRHSIESQETAIFVARYNTFSGGWSTHGAIDTHGAGSSRPETYSTVSFEIYNNDFTLNLCDRGAFEGGHISGCCIRAGSGVIHHNTFHSYNGSSASSCMRLSSLDISSHTPAFSYPADYPISWQPRNIYSWSNTYDGAPVKLYSTSSNWFVEDRFTGGYYDYRNVQKPGYVPYTYPHPLRLTSQPLNASAQATPSSGAVPLTVNFSGSGTGGIPPYSYKWDFGDGQTSAARNPSHTYTAVGSYSASLTVKDSQGAQATDLLTIRVTQTDDTLSVTASASPTVGLPPLTVSFTGSVSGGTSPYTYRWDFGDGGSSTTLNSSHTYEAIGNYTATLTVTDASSDTAASSVGITVTSTSAFNLMISSKTGAPAPGPGGTTSPAPGTHSFAAGATAWPKALANADYRFSRWSGDISSSYLFNSQTAITMNANKSISATFCAKCADVNGDLAITPSDAQAAFDIFLGKLSDPTWCELENGDVNLSGTRLSPSVTPSDAQLIFKRYLKRGVAASDCSGNSRSANALTESSPAPATKLTLNTPAFEPGQDIAVPILLEASSDVAAFGFDLEYPPDKLEFLGLERTDLTTLFTQLEGHPLKARGSDAEALFVVEEPSPDIDFTPPDVLDYGALRVGGYKLTSTDGPVSGVLVTVIFRVIGDIGEEIPLAIRAVYDDLRNATVSNGVIRKQDRRNNEEVPRTNRRKSAAKRYDS